MYNVRPHQVSESLIARPLTQPLSMPKLPAMISIILKYTSMILGKRALRDLMMQGVLYQALVLHKSMEVSNQLVVITDLLSWDDGNKEPTFYPGFGSLRR